MVNNFPTKKYSVIYIDPPWPMKLSKRKVRPNQVEMPYKTMTLKDIEDLPIASISQENATLWLWTTHRYLPDALRCMSRWGFKYQRVITWDKGNGMSLFGFHHRTELLFFGYKGKLEPFPKRQTFPTLIQERSQKHSRKPDLARQLIEPFGEDRIELFARELAPGWDSFGDQLPKEEPV